MKCVKVVAASKAKRKGGSQRLRRVDRCRTGDWFPWTSGWGMPVLYDLCTGFGGLGMNKCMNHDY